MAGEGRLNNGRVSGSNSRHTPLTGQKEKTTTMNVKKLTMIAFALCVTLLASAAAYAQGTATISAKPGTLIVAPDIEVKIEMFEDQACTKVIPNGANLSY